jgi:MFS family permease
MLLPRKWEMRYPRKVWVLGFGMFVYLTGMSFLWPLITIYTTQQLGGSMRIAGLVLMVYQGAGMVGSLLGGMLYDRYGARRIIPIGAVGAAVFVFILPWIESIGIFAFILSLSGVCINVVFPIMYALVGDACRRLT